MIEVTIGKKNYKLPEKWEELTSEQYLTVIELLFGADDDTVMKLQLFFSFCKLTPAAIFKLQKGNAEEKEKKQLAFAAQLVEEVLPCFDFIFHDAFTKNLLPEVKAHGQVHYGPKDKLLDITGEEIKYCEYLSAMYEDDKEHTDFLVQLAAVLYRRKENGQKMSFNKNTLERDAERMCDLSSTQLQAIYLFYRSCWSFHAEQNPNVFKPGEKGETDPAAWRSILRAMAGDKRGTVAQVEQLDIQEILFELNQLEQEREAAELAIKK